MTGAGSAASFNPQGAEYVSHQTTRFMPHQAVATPSNQGGRPQRHAPNASSHSDAQVPLLSEHEQHGIMMREFLSQREEAKAARMREGADALNSANTTAPMASKEDGESPPPGYEETLFKSGLHDFK